MHDPLPDCALDIRDLCKRYRKVDALRGVNLTVKRGEVFGLLGPNGAGKSTLVKSLMTIVRPTSGGGTLLGQPLGHRQTLAKVGYLPEHARLTEHLTGRQVVTFFAQMAGLGGHGLAGRVDAALDRVGAGSYADRRVKTYSKGMKQRTGVAQALVADPDLVILDEPTDGVDPVGRKDIRDLILRLKAEGKTVFINSHQLLELEQICDRVAMLVSGQIVLEGTMRDLTFAQQHYRVEWGGGPAPADFAALPGWTLTRVDGPTTHFSSAVNAEAEVGAGILKLAVREAESVQPCLDFLRARGAIQAMAAVRPSLEDLYMQATGRATDGAPSLKKGSAK